MRTALNTSGIVFLVGFMGCGKTTIGQRLAKRLGGCFIDLDERITQSTGRAIPELFQQEGEAGFRQVEQAVLRQVCAELAQDPTRWQIVALGGGTFTVAENRADIRRIGCSIWLDVPFEVLATRIAGDGSRPLWKSLADAQKLYESRRAAYAQADIGVLVGASPPGEAVEAILHALALWMGSQNNVRNNLNDLTEQPL
ncbi:shikimate kinase [Chloracidobacterium validum]|uniref:Shikimate kinase n=1 Tax=Chloracidobacterium validum TaxID=2821543 RepID=A0ABX8B759_9BACT|nr:shikimate kinase [Chloracidobacterium validum]QUW02509.1 shikimate kinase [Chloracidobacterium validum]